MGKGIYTHFLDAKGGVRADLTVLRLGQDEAVGYRAWYNAQNSKLRS